MNALRLVQTLGNYSVYVRDIKQLMLALKKEMDKGVVRSPTTSLFLEASNVVHVMLTMPSVCCSLLGAFTTSKR